MRRRIAYILPILICLVAAVIAAAIPAVTSAEGSSPDIGRAAELSEIYGLDTPDSSASPPAAASLRGDIGMSYSSSLLYLLLNPLTAILHFVVEFIR
ncbi:hypothetical protein DCC85_21220 [Paenibacillus sp. CAA11]|uniref:hypothetical protein n=1 Tax=Paenibacillus sp. CAA11 TaxID=1532905 RepID=UPI000D363F20|nr:hypothetical protein [Paenibacillus sp. CAA11]AWB46440.1 hypothetical protein DCC85_21220 [Paenibacillus sp. CAA11]